MPLMKDFLKNYVHQISLVKIELKDLLKSRSRLYSARSGSLISFPQCGHSTSDIFSSQIKELQWLYTSTISIFLQVFEIFRVVHYFSSLSDFTLVVK